MTRTLEQTSNLQKLVGVIDMISAPDFGKKNVAFGYVDGHHKCGTFHCVLGWYNHVTNNDLDYLGHQCRQHFGIDDEQAGKLFDPVESERRNHLNHPDRPGFNRKGVLAELKKRRRLARKLLLESDA